MSADALNRQAVRPLGSTYEIRVTLAEESPNLVQDAELRAADIDRRLLKYYRQNLARQLIPKERTATTCARRIVPGHDRVTVNYSPGAQRARFGNLMQCGSVWHCPVCAARITELRALELRRAVMLWTSGRGFVSLATYTTRHNIRQSLDEIANKAKAALRRFKSGKTYQAIKAAGAITGDVMATEITHGQSGWHVHFHGLTFHEPIGDASWNQYLQAARRYWVKCLKAVGLDGLEYVAFDARLGDADVYAYIAKFGRDAARVWTIDREVAKSASKTGHAESRTPNDLLDSFGDGDLRAGQLWQEYARVMKGKRQLRWSPGLRDELDMEQETPDEKLQLDELDELDELLASIPREAWNRHGQQIRIQILKIASEGDRDKLRRFLNQHGVDMLDESAQVDRPGQAARVDRPRKVWDTCMIDGNPSTLGAKSKRVSLSRSQLVGMRPTEPFYLGRFFYLPPD